MFENLERSPDVSLPESHEETGCIRQEAMETFNHLMGDDTLPEEPSLGDVAEVAESEGLTETAAEMDQRGAVRFDELTGDQAVPETVEKDDNGQVYKADGRLLPDMFYTIGACTYYTDRSGRIIRCEGDVFKKEAGQRNPAAQQEVGGEDRHEHDDGGHIIANMFGGAEGEENLVPMLATINRGDYKKMENEMAGAITEGEKPSLKVDIEYDGESRRPSQMKAVYIIDGRRTEISFDNDEHSTDLLKETKEILPEAQYKELSQEIQDMKDDGCRPSITSVKKEYDEEGHLCRTTTGILNGTTGEKIYKVYDGKGGK